VSGGFVAYDALVRERAPRLLEELKALVRQPSVSAQQLGIMETAELVLARARAAGFAAQALHAPGGPPTIVGESGGGPRTLLLYNHYDVQPPDPLEEWVTPPFEPVERDGYLFGRGVSDNKGNLIARLQAIETYREVFGELPLRLRLLYDGEEEVGSPHLQAFVDAFGDRLRADGCIWEAGYKDAAGRQVVSFGVKGIAYFDVRVRSITKDAHSSVGTIIPNAAWRLIWALGTIKNERCEITVDGFMDQVDEPTAADLELLERVPYDEEGMKRIHGISHFVAGASGLDLKRRHFFGPTATVCGLTSGYAGEGSKTVLPAVASAKLDFRLVPRLQPATVAALLRAHLDRRGFQDVELTLLHSEAPYRSPVDTAVARASIAACRATYGEDPVVYPLMFGSGPMSQVVETLHIPSTSFGSGNARSANHAPNENIAIADYVDHIRAFGRFIHLFAGLPV
jgi:acetylornithine deacetylase/succinyl-diaminopimelate desuccinylase-like protein